MTEEEQDDTKPPRIDTNNNVAFPAFRGRCFCHKTDNGDGFWRQQELLSLQEIYQCSKGRKSNDDGATNATPVVLVSGPAGSGRTTLMKEFEKVVVSEDEFFFTVTHNNSWSIQLPHRVLLQALVSFVEGARSNDRLMERIQKQAASDPKRFKNLQDSMSEIPVMKELFSKIETSSAANSDTVNSNLNNLPNEPQNLPAHFRYFFSSFLHLLSDHAHPLVLAIDNIQWANEETLAIINSIVRDPSHQRIFVVGILRDDPDGFQSTRQRSMVEKWGNNATIHRIQLQNLETESNTQQLLARLFRTDLTGMDELTDLIHTATKGNMLSVDQALSWLQEDGSLSFREHPGKWSIKIKEDRPSLNTKERILSLVSSLPKDQYDILQCLVCCGFEIDANLVLHIGTQSTVDLVVKKLSLEGLLYRYESGGVSFTHEMLHEVLYHSLPKKERTYRHYRLARQLWKRLDLQSIDEFMLCSIVKNFQVGQEHLSDDIRERLAIARLCLSSAKIAVRMGIFLEAQEYLSFGRQLLGDRRWRDDYDLCLDLFGASAEIAFCTIRLDDVNNLVEETIANARSYRDTLQVRTTKVCTIGTKGHPADAIVYACDVLNELGISISLKPTLLHVKRALLKTKLLLQGKSDDMIRRLPLMDDPERLAAMKIMSVIFTYCFAFNPRMAPLLAHEMIRQTLLYGISPMSSFGFVLYGAMLSRSLGHNQEGYRYGKLALSIIQNNFYADVWLARVSAIYYVGIFGWRNRFVDALEHIEIARRECLRVGDTEFAMRVANISIICRGDVVTLTDLANSLQFIRNEAQFYDDRFITLMILPSMFMVLSLTGKKDAFLAEATSLPRFSKTEAHYGFSLWAALAQMQVSYLFGEYEDAYCHSRDCASMLPLLRQGIGAPGDAALPYFYDGLTNLALARRKKGLPALRHLIRAKAGLRSVRELARKSAPINYLGKAYLLEAEIKAYERRDLLAFSLYTSSISLSHDGGFFIGTALAKERTGKFFANRQENEMASKFLTDAISAYRDCGAHAKAEHLKQEVRRFIG